MKKLNFVKIFIFIINIFLIMCKPNPDSSSADPSSGKNSKKKVSFNTYLSNASGVQNNAFEFRDLINKNSERNMVFNFADKALQNLTFGDLFSEELKEKSFNEEVQKFVEYVNKKPNIARNEVLKLITGTDNSIPKDKKVDKFTEKELKLLKKEAGKIAIDLKSKIKKASDQEKTALEAQEKLIKKAKSVNKTNSKTITDIRKMNLKDLFWYFPFTDMSDIDKDQRVSEGKRLSLIMPLPKEISLSDGESLSKKWDTTFSYSNQKNDQDPHKTALKLYDLIYFKLFLTSKQGSKVFNKDNFSTDIKPEESMLPKVLKLREDFYKGPVGNLQVKEKTLTDIYKNGDIIGITECTESLANMMKNAGFYVIGKGNNNTRLCINKSKYDYKEDSIDINLKNEFVCAKVKEKSTGKEFLVAVFHANGKGTDNEEPFKILDKKGKTDPSLPILYMADANTSVIEKEYKKGSKFSFPKFKEMSEKTYGFEIINDMKKNTVHKQREFTTQIGKMKDLKKDISDVILLKGKAIKGNFSILKGPGPNTENPTDHSIIETKVQR